MPERLRLATPRGGLFLSVHLRQLVIFLVILSGTILAAALLVARLGHDRVMELGRAQLRREAQLIARAALHHRATPAPTSWQAEAAYFGDRAAQREFPYVVGFFDASGASLGHSDPTLLPGVTPPEVAQALRGGEGSAVRLSAAPGDGREFLFVALAVEGAPEGLAAVQVGRSTQAYRTTIDELTLAILFGAVLALLASVITGLLSARLIARPVAWMSTLAQRMAAGEPLRIDSSRQDELGVLAASINYLSDQLTARIDQAHNDKVLLSTILDGMAEGVIVANTRGQVVLVNPAAVKLLELGARAEIEGRPAQELATPPELYEAMSEAIAQRLPIHRDLTLHQLTPIHLAVTAAPTREGDAVIGAVAVIHDITRIRLLERVRRDFVANVSHELRTPIATITGYAETLLSGPLELDPMAREFVEAIERNGRRISLLVQDLLILARLEAQGEGPPLGPVYLSGPVAEVLDALTPLASSQGVALRVDLDEVPPVMAEARALTQVLRNLIENAIKYTDKGGEVTLSARAQPGRVVIQVRDTGIGIEAVHLPRIFERFYRVDEGRSRDRGGTGLGLAIAKHMVQALHGEISALSIPGAGSTFTIHLPVAPEAVEDQPSSM